MYKISITDVWVSPKYASIYSKPTEAFFVRYFNVFLLLSFSQVSKQSIWNKTLDKYICKLVDVVHNFYFSWKFTYLFCFNLLLGTPINIFSFLWLCFLLPCVFIRSSCHRCIQNPVKYLQFCENSSRFSAVNHFCKIHHFKYLTGFWLGLCMSMKIFSTFQII